MADFFIYRIKHNNFQNTDNQYFETRKETRKLILMKILNVLPGITAEIFSESKGDIGRYA